MKFLKISSYTILALAIIMLLMGFSDWHLKRNEHNILPTGKLMLVEGMMYEDEAGLQWELQPHIKNMFHQPDDPTGVIENPYPNINPPIEFDPNNSNLKFLSSIPEGGSHEAIIQPDGTFLTKGLKQGTYNYGHPSGFWGSFKHTILDVLPHFVNPKYEE